MKLIKIIILLSVFLGFSSVYAQTSNTETKKNDLEIKTEQADPEIKAASQQQVLNAGEETPATTKAPATTSQKQKDVFVKTRPYPNEVDEAQLQYAKDNPSTTKDNRSEQQFTPANPDPNKTNLNAKDNNYD
jgi:transposase